MGGWDGDGDRDRSCAATNLQARLRHGAVQAVPPHLWGVLCWSCITAWVPPRWLECAHRAFPSPSHRMHETLILLLPAAPSPSSHSECHKL